MQLDRASGTTSDGENTSQPPCTFSLLNVSTFFYGTQHGLF